MAYDTRWDPRRPEDCRKKAEERVGPSPLGYLYRLVDASYSVIIDAERERYGVEHQVELQAFVIRARTPKGFTIWLVPPPRAGHFTVSRRDGRVTRFVMTEATKRFALPTIEEAVTSYVARKEKQARIYDARAKMAQWYRDRAQLPTGVWDVLEPTR